MKVLFVCVGNTCRSQMAEGWARHLGIDASSAGTKSDSGQPADPKAVQAMAEIGIDISAALSKHVSQFSVVDFDYSATMGCDAQCSSEIRIDDDWNLPDPYGSAIEVYRETRDLIEKRVRALLK